MSLNVVYGKLVFIPCILYIKLYLIIEGIWMHFLLMFKFKFKFKNTLLLPIYNLFHINIYSTFSQVQKFIRIILLYINWIWSWHKISAFQWMLWLIPTPQLDTQSLCIQYTTYKQNSSCGHMPDLQHKCTDTDMSTRYWHIYTFHQMGAEGARSQGGFMDSLSGIQIIKLG